LKKEIPPYQCADEYYHKTAMMYSTVRKGFFFVLHTYWVALWKHRFVAQQCLTMGKLIPTAREISEESVT